MGLSSWEDNPISLMLFLIVLRLVWFIDCFYLKIYKPFFEIDRYRCGKCLGSMTILTEGEAHV